MLKRYKVGTSPFTPPILGNITGHPRRGRRGHGHELARLLGRPGTARGLRAGVERAVVAIAGGFAAGLLRHPLRGSGMAGRPFREVLGPGDCCAADGSGKPFAPTNLPASATAPPPPVSAADTAASNAGLTVQGLPIYKPPYGMISAISLDRGEIMWQITRGRHAGQHSQSPVAARHEHSRRPGSRVSRASA